MKLPKYIGRQLQSPNKSVNFKNITFSTLWCQCDYSLKLFSRFLYLFPYYVPLQNKTQCTETRGAAAVYCYFKVPRLLIIKSADNCVNIKILKQLNSNLPIYHREFRLFLPEDGPAINKR